MCLPEFQNLMGAGGGCRMGPLKFKGRAKSRLDLFASCSLDTSGACSNNSLMGITEHKGEDIDGMYTYSNDCSRVAICLDELVKPTKEKDPQNEVVSLAEVWEE